MVAGSTSMLLTRHDIDELKAIHKERFGVELPDEEAWEMGRRLMRLFTVLFRAPLKAGQGQRDSSNPVQFDRD
jgi:hypothetical protein